MTPMKEFEMNMFETVDLKPSSEVCAEVGVAAPTKTLSEEVGAPVFQLAVAMFAAGALLVLAARERMKRTQY